MISEMKVGAASEAIRAPLHAAAHACRSPSAVIFMQTAVLSVSTPAARTDIKSRQKCRDATSTRLVRSRSGSLPDPTFPPSETQYGSRRRPTINFCRCSQRKETVVAAAVFGWGGVGWGGGSTGEQRSRVSSCDRLSILRFTYF